MLCVGPILIFSFCQRENGHPKNYALCIVCFNCECEETKRFQQRRKNAGVFVHAQAGLACILWMSALMVYFVLI